MIKREIFVATIMAFPAEFAKFAHAYGSYCGELKKAHKRIPDSVIRSGEMIEEADYNPAVRRMTNWAADELFNLNKLCKATRTIGFIDRKVEKNEKEDLINEAFEIVTSLQVKNA
ncbi:hypothetical protein DW886_15860 [Enterocloster aldenensis]|uniref:hypothetical protein n=1 Tax=Enterocloster aldenensis TaxID=358742 RepID=UPI000E4D55BF|nr:hypothetical protein DW886_15860 [Enterocloster aldenensis]